MGIPFSRRHPALRMAFAAIWVVVIGVGLIAGLTVWSRTRDQWKPPPGSESERNAQELFASGAAGNGITAIVYGDPNDPKVAADITDAITDVQRLDGIAVVVSYPTTKYEALRGEDGKTSAIFAFLKTDDRDKVRDVAAKAEQRLLWIPSAKKVVVSNETFYDETVSAFVATDNQLSQLANVMAFAVVLLVGFWGVKRVLLFVPIAIGTAAVAWLIMWPIAGMVQIPRLPVQMLASLATIIVMVEWRLVVTVYPRRIPYRVPAAITFAVVAPAIGTLALSTDVTVRAVAIVMAVSGVAACAITVGFIPVWLQWCRPWLDTIPDRQPRWLPSDAWQAAATGVFVLVIGIAAVGILGVKFRPSNAADLPATTPIRLNLEELAKNYPTLPVESATVLAQAPPNDPNMQAFIDRLTQVHGVGSAHLRPLIVPSAQGVSLVDVQLDEHVDVDGPITQLRAVPAPFPFTVGGNAATLADRQAASPHVWWACVGGVVALVVSGWWASRSLRRGVVAGLSGAAVLVATAGTAGWIFATGNGTIISDYAGTGRLDWYTPFFVGALVWPVAVAALVHTAVYTKRQVVPDAWLCTGIGAIYLVGVFATGRTTKEWAVSAAAGCVVTAVVSLIASQAKTSTPDEGFAGTVPYSSPQAVL